MSQTFLIFDLIVEGDIYEIFGHALGRPEQQQFRRWGGDGTKDEVTRCTVSPWSQVWPHDCCRQLGEGFHGPKPSGAGDGGKGVIQVPGERAGWALVTHAWHEEAQGCVFALGDQPSTEMWNMKLGDGHLWEAMSPCLWYKLEVPRELPEMTKWGWGEFGC